MFLLGIQHRDRWFQIVRYDINPESTQTVQQETEPKKTINAKVVYNPDPDDMIVIAIQ